MDKSKIILCNSISCTRQVNCNTHKKNITDSIRFKKKDYSMDKSCFNSNIEGDDIDLLSVKYNIFNESKCLRFIRIPLLTEQIKH